MLDIIGHCAYGLIALSLYLLSKKNGLGFLLQAFGAMIWIVLGIMMGLSSIYIWNVVFASINIYAYIRWKNE